MRPILCTGGYPLPVKKGMCHIVGYDMSVNAVASASRITLIDQDPFSDLGKALPTEDVNQKNVIVDHKGMASIDNALSYTFAEPIKAINGVCLMNATNLLPGRMIVYIQ